MARRVGFNRTPRGQVPPMKTRIIVGMMLTVWLSLWSYGIYFVATSLTGEAAPEGIGSVMVMVWLVLAGIGLLFGLRILSRIIRGVPIRKARSIRQPPPFPRENGPGESDRGFDN